MKGNIHMPRYTDEELIKNNKESSSVIINIAAVLTAVLISTGIVGALIWLNIFIWSKVF